MEFLYLIHRRFYDKISHVRVKAMKKFIKIVINDDITLEPFTFFLDLLADAASRMRDTAANVRKNALRLFSAIISKMTKSNFFEGQTLSLEESSKNS
jgi:hypothetical protein